MQALPTRAGKPPPVPRDTPAVTPLFSKCGTHKTVEARFCPWLSRIKPTEPRANGGSVGLRICGFCGEANRDCPTHMHPSCEVKDSEFRIHGLVERAVRLAKQGFGNACWNASTFFASYSTCSEDFKEPRMKTAMNRDQKTEPRSG